MNNIQKAFGNGKAFVSFVTCGDPNLETTEQLIYGIERAGVDLIELGIPFSDPTAEGIVIQSANERALKQGVTTDKIFDMVARTKGKVKIPLVFMTYANVLFSYGIEKFVKKAKDVGVSGIILPDIPFEEKSEFSDICKLHDIAFISLIAPNSEKRVEMIAKEAEGFVYCVSSLGVTGVRSELNQNISKTIDLIRANTKIPCAIGFGISTPEQAKKMSAYADGVIVGSAIVKLCEEHGENCVEPICNYVKRMKEAIS